MLKKEKNTNLRERGITLIALVITIIVLLILAGVAISELTGDSGILSNAEKAKEQTSLANAKEQIALAAQGARLENVAETGNFAVTYAKLEKELNNIVGTGKYKIEPKEETDEWIVTVGEYRAIVYKNGEIVKALPIGEGTTPWLPYGFKQVEGTDLSNGLTITNETGLQNYVWIEVPRTISASIIRNGETLTVTLENAKDNTEILEILEVYAGKGTTTSYRNSSYQDEWYDSTGKNASTSSNLEDIYGCGMTYVEYQSTYSKMVNSIKKYGGFWLAQYEAGIEYEEEGQTATNRTGDELSVTNPGPANYAKDQYPYNFLYCWDAQRIANEDSTEKYTSSLPFGIQWDLVCKFLEVKEVKTYNEIAQNSIWGNYCNVGWTSSATSKYCTDEKTFTGGSLTKDSGRYLLTTGAIEKVKLDTKEYPTNPMNIYDFAGNVTEYTLEHYVGDSNYHCCVRGGDYLYGWTSTTTAASRVDRNIKSWWDVHVGFRSSLYK